MDIPADVRLADVTTPLPFNSHRVSAPVNVFRQRMSLIPSLLKSSGLTIAMERVLSANADLPA
jgi:hypothetical protein